jgi:excisionase family DNA binding protein
METDDVRPVLYNVPASTRALGGISRAKFYELVKNGEISTVHIGSRVFVHREEIERYAASLTTLK